MVTQLGTHLEPDEPSRPGGESAVATKLARLADDQQQRIGGCLARDVVEVRAAEVMCGAPLPDLELRGAKKYGVQITACALVVHSPAGQSVHPSSVLRTEGVAGRRGLPAGEREVAGHSPTDGGPVCYARPGRPNENRLPSSNCRRHHALRVASWIGRPLPGPTRLVLGCQSHRGSGSTHAASRTRVPASRIGLSGTVWSLTLRSSSRRRSPPDDRESPYSRQERHVLNHWTGLSRP